METLFEKILNKLTLVFSGVDEAIALSAVLVAFLMSIEVVSIGWRRSSLRNLINGGTTSVLDAVTAILVLTNVALVMGFVLSFGTLYLIGHTLKGVWGIGLLNYDSYPITGFFLYILFLDFSNYWAHRWMHKSPRLWLIHRFHHSATDMTMLTALRDHPLERSFLHCVNAVPAGLLGIPPEQYLLISIIMQAIGFLKHSNFNSGWGFLGRWIIQSPLAHRLHHSSNLAHHDCNFASIFQFWDVLFKTARESNEEEIIHIGVSDWPSSTSLTKAYLDVTISFYSSIFFWRKNKS